MPGIGIVCDEEDPMAIEKPAAPPPDLMFRQGGMSASPYEKWIASTGLPIHRGYFIEDVRTVEVGWWEERGCNAAFLVLAGQEGVTEARVTEIAPGKSLPPSRFAL